MKTGTILQIKPTRKLHDSGFRILKVFVDDEDDKPLSQMCDVIDLSVNGTKVRIDIDRSGFFRRAYEVIQGDIIKMKKLNFKRKITNDKGCRNCNHNEVGVCELCERELPMRILRENFTPAWCPKQK